MDKTEAVAQAGHAAGKSQTGVSSAALHSDKLRLPLTRSQQQADIITLTNQNDRWARLLQSTESKHQSAENAGRHGDDA